MVGKSSDMSNADELTMGQTNREVVNLPVWDSRRYPKRGSRSVGVL